MTTETTAKAPLHQRAMHELKEVVFITLYLYVTFGAVILMKTAVLHTQGVEFTPWGIAIVKAVVLAKFMLLGEAMRIGGRSTTGPLIWPTLQKAFGLLVLLIIMTIIEEAVVGLRPPPVDRRLARRTLWFSPGGNARWLPDHADGAASVLRVPRARGGAR